MSNKKIMTVGIAVIVIAIIGIVGILSMKSSTEDTVQAKGVSGVDKIDIAEEQELLIKDLNASIANAETLLAETKDKVIDVESYSKLEAKVVEAKELVLGVDKPNEENLSKIRNIFLEVDDLITVVSESNQAWLEANPEVVNDEVVEAPEATTPGESKKPSSNNGSGNSSKPAPSPSPTKPTTPAPQPTQPPVTTPPPAPQPTPTFTVAQAMSRAGVGNSSFDRPCRSMTADEGYRWETLTQTFGANNSYKFTQVTERMVKVEVKLC